MGLEWVGLGRGGFRVGVGLGRFRVGWVWVG